MATLDQSKSKIILSGLALASWEELMYSAIHKMLSDYGPFVEAHTGRTPARVVDAYKEYFNGYNQDPEDILSVTFPVKGTPSMVIVGDIYINSLCMHHLIPFFGKAYFGYVPDKIEVGLSKIARLIDCFSHRAQVQEDLGEQIVDAFQDLVKPLGCGLVIKAEHMCMCVRGVKKPGAWTRTTAIRGTFLHNPNVKLEFLESIR